MKFSVVVLLFLVALLLPGGLIGLYVAREFYRRVYLRRDVARLRKELGIPEAVKAASHPSASGAAK